MTSNALLELAQALTRRGEPYAMITVVRVTAPTSAWVGAQAIVRGDGTLEGWIGGGCAKDVVVAAAREAIAAGEPKLVRISNEQLQAEPGIEEHPMSCASNGTIELFVHPHSARSVLCVLGATPAADEARFLADRLGIRLAEVPDEVPVVLVATQGHGDEDALERALASPATHVLLIASRRKADRLREVMRTRGITDLQLARLQAPAGPDASAKTPTEIALVAMVGVLAALRAHRPEVAAADAVPASGGAIEASGATFVNPVCGIAVSVANPKHVERYQGVSYYFCCDCCWTTFRANPAKYASIHIASPPRVSA
ncbi:MAG TPA: XdhC family protein [Casimicrobiaceae bacterium]|nr:XdhC family protein [Casimicrobiaceae bacterium]